MSIRYTSLVTALLCMLFSGFGAAESLGAFERVKAKTFAKDKFVFPESLDGSRLNILFLAMSPDQENGQYQQEALLQWHDALTERGVFDENVVAYHFPVLAGVPFFVKGLVSGAMRDSYEGRISLDRGGILFIDDLDAFADAAKLPLDLTPTIVIADANGAPLAYFKGEVSDAGVDEIAAAIGKLLGGDDGGSTS